MNKKSSTNYTDEFKQSSAKLAATSNKTIREMANELGVNAKTLYGWVKRYYLHQQAKLGRWSDIETKCLSAISRIFQRKKDGFI